MPKSVNKVILLGRLGKDPELKYTPQGTPVATFSMATNHGYKDKQGNWQDQTEWTNIVAWARTAEIAGEYLHKGDQCYVEGRLQTRSWEDKQTGQKRYMTEVVVDDLVLIGGRHEDRYTQEPAQNQNSNRKSSGGQGRREPEPVVDEITDSDIPFSWQGRACENALSA